MAEQRTQEWLDQRVGKATASRFGDVMATIKHGEAAAKKNYRAELVIERLTGEPTETYTSQAMQWGIDTEPLAKLQYSLESGREVEDCEFVEHEKLAAGASPDGKVVGENGGIEVKCPNPATHIETLKSKSIPQQYYWQMMGQMWLTGWDWIDYVSFDPRFPENAQMCVIRLERDEDAVEKLESAVVDFLHTVDGEVEFVKDWR